MKMGLGWDGVCMKDQNLLLRAFGSFVDLPRRDD